MIGTKYKSQFKAQRGEILYSRGNISSGKTVYIELQYLFMHIRPDGVMV